MEPDCKKLGRGPRAYVKTTKRECGLNELCKFLVTHVAGSDGVRRIERILKTNKGASYFPDVMTLEHVTYVVWTMENHIDQWRHKLWIETLEEDERLKARDYKNLPQDERVKYAPKKTKYTSGEGTKREYGKTLVSNKGKKRFEEIKKNWKVAWEDEGIRAALTEEWKKIAAKYNRCQGYSGKKTDEAEGVDGEEEGREEEELVPVIDLQGIHGSHDGVPLIPYPV